MTVSLEANRISGDNFPPASRNHVLRFIPEEPKRKVSMVYDIGVRPHVGDSKAAIIDGFPGTNYSESDGALYFKHLAGEIEYLQHLNQEGEFTGASHTVNLGWERTYGDTSGPVHIWGSSHDINPNAAVIERNSHAGYDGGISAHLGQAIAGSLMKPVIDYWWPMGDARIFYDEMGAAIWLDRFQTKHLQDNCEGRVKLNRFGETEEQRKSREYKEHLRGEDRGVDIATGLVTHIDQAVDRQFGLYHLESAQTDWPMGWDENTTVEPQLDAYRRAGLLLTPPRVITSMTFVPEIPGVTADGLLINIITNVTKGQTEGVVDLVNLVQGKRPHEVLPPNALSDRLRRF